MFRTLTLNKTPQMKFEDRNRMCARAGAGDGSGGEYGGGERAVQQGQGCHRQGVPGTGAAPATGRHGQHHRRRRHRGPDHVRRGKHDGPCTPSMVVTNNCMVATSALRSVAVARIGLVLIAPRTCS